MPFRVIRPGDLTWITRPHEPGEPARHVAELSELAGFAHTRANIWRYEPGAKGRRHWRHPFQEETFVVLSGSMSMYLGDPPERRDVPPGGLVHVPPGTPLQTVNHGDGDLLVYAYGTPRESEHAEILESAVQTSRDPACRSATPTRKDQHAGDGPGVVDQPVANPHEDTVRPVRRDDRAFRARPPAAGARRG